MPKIDPERCAEANGTLYPEPYRERVRPRRARRLGPASGLTDFGASLVTLPPGAWSSQRHWHEEDDELLVMLSGAAVLIEDAGRTALRPGDIVAWPKNSGDGHHLVNESDGDATFLVVGANKGGAVYPDIDLLMHPGEGFYRHRDGTPYRVYARDE